MMTFSIAFVFACLREKYHTNEIEKFRDDFHIFMQGKSTAETSGGIPLYFIEDVNQFLEEM